MSRAPRGAWAGCGRHEIPGTRAFRFELTDPAPERLLAVSRQWSLALEPTEDA